MDVRQSRDCSPRRPLARLAPRRVQCPRTKRHARRRGDSPDDVSSVFARRSPRDVFETEKLEAHFFAYESVMLCVGLILNPCSPESATALRVSESNSTKAMPGFASTMHTSVNPGNCWNSIESIDAVVASARVAFAVGGKKNKKRATRVRRSDTATPRKGTRGMSAKTC